MEIPPNPLPVGSTSAHQSIPTTIEIVIDLPHLGPVAIRSHLLSWSLLGRQTQLVLQAKVLDTGMFSWHHVSRIVSHDG